MALNIKNSEVERLAAEVAGLAGESKTEAVRRALLDRKQRLIVRRGNTARSERLQRLLQNRIWPEIPAEILGRRVSKKEREEILGYEAHGV